MKILLIGTLTFLSLTSFAEASCKINILNYRSLPGLNSVLPVSKNQIRAIESKGYTVVTRGEKADFEISFGMSRDHNDFISLLPKTKDIRISSFQDVKNAIRSGRSQVPLRYWDNRLVRFIPMNSIIKNMPSCEDLADLVEKDLSLINGEVVTYQSLIKD